MEKANFIALADAGNGQLVRLEIPSQQTTIELTDEKVVKQLQKTQAEEVLARSFASSNVRFDDFLKVSKMVATIDVTVIGSGIDNDLSVLDTVMQTFKGKKEVDHITGTVTIASVPFRPTDSPPFPSPDTSLTGLEAFVKPEVYIESDDPVIVAKAAELTKGATTRWEAVTRIGDWVYKQITYTIADTPSARLALEKRTGDCGPHSTLMVAMLRASRIPSRLVGGLVYTPTFGGSFGQHAWVEVHMGSAGWVPMDPTTGEFKQMSAAHIKLFEGLGGAVPKTIHVVSFAPPNRESTAAPRQAKSLAWKPGTKYTYSYKKGEQDLGTETFSISKIKHAGKDAYELKSTIELRLSPMASLKSNTKLVSATNGTPLAFERNLSVPGREVTIKCTFSGGSVKEEIGGAQQMTREVKLPAGAFCFDNNLTSSFAVICSQLTLEPGKAVTVQTFHPPSLQVIPITITPKAPAKISIGGKEIECYECDVAPIRNTFWISRDGRLLRATQGGLSIEVSPVD